MTIGTSNKDAFQEKLEGAKLSADQNIAQALAHIEETLRASAAQLRAAGQTVNLNMDEVVERLNAVKKEWLDHVGATFDSAILRLKNNVR